MKKNFKLAAFIFTLLIGFFLPIAELNADAKSPFSSPEASISMDFQDANLKDVLKAFSMQSGLNFIASEALQERKITLYLDNVPLSKTMDKLFKANNLSYELDEEAKIFLVKDWGKPQIETITKVFYLKYATVSSSSLKTEMATSIGAGGEEKGGSAAGGGAGAAAGGAAAGGGGGAEGGGGGGGAEGKWAVEEDTGITKAIKKIVSEFGSVIEDFRTNSLIVTDIPSRMPVIEQTIAALDMPVPQVMLEVEMLDVSKNTVEKIGIKFGDTTSYPNILTMTAKGAKRNTGFPLKAFSSSDVRTTGSFTDGEVSFASNYQILLSFIKAQTDTKYLARPRLLTLNNETAEIKIITQETVGTTTSTVAGEGLTETSTNVPERVETGVALRVTPQINLETGEITMFIMPVVKDTSTSTFISSGTTYFKDPEERSTKTMVRIKDGETVIVGGLIRNESSETITKLPFLGDIPIFGGLFRHKNKEKGRERELLVFITPHIIRDTAVELAQTKKLTLPEREQNTVSGVNRELAINTSLNNFDKKKR